MPDPVEGQESTTTEEAKTPTIEDLQAALAAKDTEIANEKARAEREASARVEADKQAQFHYERSTRVMAAALGKDDKAKEEADDDDLPIPENPFELVADPKKFKSFLHQFTQKEISKGGYVKASELEARVAREKEEMTALSPYFAKYPELNDPKSELNQLVLAESKRIGENPIYKGLQPAQVSVMALDLASKQYEVDKAKRTTADEAEAARVRRIGAQGGATGRGRPSKGSEITADQRAAADKLMDHIKDPTERYQRYMENYDKMYVGPGLAAQLNQGGR